LPVFRISGGIRPTFTQPFLADCRLSGEAPLSSLFAETDAIGDYLRYPDLQVRPPLLVKTKKIR